MSITTEELKEEMERFSEACRMLRLEIKAIKETLDESIAKKKDDHSQACIRYHEFIFKNIHSREEIK